MEAEGRCLHRLIRMMETERKRRVIVNLAKYLMELYKNVS